MTIPELRVIVGRQMGLPLAFDGTRTAYGNLTAAQQVTLTQGMLDYIRNNPGQFTSAQVETANVEGPRIAGATIEDTSFDWGMFGDEVANNALELADKFAGLGRGAADTVAAVGKILPFLAVGGLVLFVFFTVKNKSSAA